MYNGQSVDPMGGASSGTSDSEPEEKSPWLDAWNDPLAGLKAFSPCICTSDLGCDGDYRLAVATLEKRLKVYKGTQVVADNALMDVPVAMCSYYMEAGSSIPPAIAVAARSHIYLYRNLRPHYKFTLPTIPINADEQSIWRQLRESEVDILESYDLLAKLREDGVKLSARSQDFLAINRADKSELGKYVSCRIALPLIQQTVITCMDVLKKSTDDTTSVGVLVVGTENGEILILAPTASSVLTKCTLRSGAVPAFFAVSGLYDVEYRIAVACRDGNVYMIKNGSVVGPPIQLEALPCGVVRLDRSIFIGCLNNSVHCFHVKGKQLWTLRMPDQIIDMAPLVMKSRGWGAVLVALRNGEVRVYKDKDLVHTIRNPEPVSAMMFGQFGREESALLLLLKSGSLSLKILPRAAKLEGKPGIKGAPPEQDIPLSVPKKTKLYVEQTQRERDNAVQMHRVFQNDLFQLRLNTAKSYVSVLSDSKGPVGAISESASVRLSAAVQGIGSQFRIKCSLTNSGAETVTNLPMVFQYDTRIYRMERNCLIVPCLVPGVGYRVDVDVFLVDDTKQTSDTVKILVLSPSFSSPTPLVGSVVHMPIPEVITM